MRDSQPPPGHPEKEGAEGSRKSPTSTRNGPNQEDTQAMMVTMSTTQKTQQGSHTPLCRRSRQRGSGRRDQQVAHREGADFTKSSNGSAERGRRGGQV